MRITIVNLKSQDSHAPAVDIDQFQAGVRAITRQVMSDFEPEWGGHATLVGVSTHLRSGRLAPIQGNREAIIYSNAAGISTTLSGSISATGLIFACSTTGWTTTWGVREVTTCVKFLFTDGEDKLLIAVATNKGLIS